MNVVNEITVLLVDDHEVVRAGYSRLLEATEGISVIGEAQDGEAAYVAFFSCHPDVLIMDLSMPGIGGLEASRRILAKDKNAKILVFSVYENEVFLTRALDMGVLGYISKRSASQVMIEAVRKVAGGDVFVGQELVSYLVKTKASVDGDLLSALTPREFEVFLLLADSKSVVDIAELLSLSPKTVGHHTTSIKNKMNISDIAGLTRLAIRMDLMAP
ncbi:Two-component transcriptional response regulator, LuxR family [hydrothermal vent metagenome]|uniref:Two-component transcriptional response regulator, LuxR family n=1 Tax=hydrothermal vent metagenome TaxID=652676 RepID=A0A3B0WPS3_9ZZZZ